MFELIFFVVIYFVIKNWSKNSSFGIINTKLNTLFKKHNFTNILKSSVNGMTLIKANSHGENYLFAFKLTNSAFTTLDIDRIYDTAQRGHIHNPVIVVLQPSFSDNILKKIKEYNIQIWDNNKLDSLTSTYTSSSVLSTSDTSDDTCKIDPSQFNPIQEPTNLWKRLFAKPDRL